MIERIAYLWPEIALFVGACVVMVIGLSPNGPTRKQTATVTGVFLLFALFLSIGTPSAPEWALLPGLMPYVKTLIAGVGLLLLLVMAGTVDRDEEAAIDAGRPFNPLRTTRAEFFAFFLFSLMGAMLCATAADLVWLFLALELTSLPTYVMVVLSGRGRSGFNRSQEAGVKYFFLGALGAAIFLYGFALLYGGTGTTRFVEMAGHFAAHGVDPISLAGLVLALIGVSFKIAAVPMHFYTADVYQGSSSSMAAFLAFVPKTAGMVSILLLAATLGWGAEGGTLPPVVDSLLWVLAIVTMTVGNVLAVLQSSVKRMLAYSSIAHSGYMLVGVVVGPGAEFQSSGIAAVLFYLLCYGVMNTGAFAVLACLERDTPNGVIEAEQMEDLRGLCRTRPVLGWAMVLCMLSLLGFPPILGFFAKVPLFTAALGAGRTVLVLALAINSAIAAFYYLRVVAAVMLEPPVIDGPREAGVPSRTLGAVVSAVGVVLLALTGGVFMRASAEAAAYEPVGHADRPGSPAHGESGGHATGAEPARTGH